MRIYRTIRRAALAGLTGALALTMSACAQPAEFTDLKGAGSLAYSFVRSVDLSGAQLSPFEF
ncbi:hypothetical protein BJ970_000068 [Saccharopolyspora phatthalungensis]|uniref:Uncharacterized protein n=1 Tax=Saccharopolyspora phatthalungensis TaxID=664693 RepID=A0A840PX90_9PSEU|nr:hypothetical protein [Saccharopolyspora phatthalungensis]